MKKLLVYCFILCTPIMLVQAEEQSNPEQTSTTKEAAVASPESTPQEEQSPITEESSQKEGGIPFAVKNTTDGVLGFIKSSVDSMGKLPGVLADNVSQGMDAGQQHESNFGITQ